MEIAVREIGKVKAGETFAVELAPEFAAGLAGLEDFSHVLLVWYADKAPAWNASALRMKKPYRLAPEELGVFATRSPYRPNGICVSVAAISSIDAKKGILGLYWTDAEDGTPVIDLKPYHPCSDRVRGAKTPKWCSHWPSCWEESSRFDWEKEFIC